jgi:hypothetical protein
MKNRRTPMSTAWALRSAVLLVAVLAAVGLPSTAGATTPAPPTDGVLASATTEPFPT